MRNKKVSEMRRVNDNGTTIYYNERGYRDRSDGPAFITSSGEEFWFVNGILHRDDGPAVIYFNGAEEYYHDGIPLMVK